MALQDLVRRVPVADHVFVYARDLVRASRPNEPEASATVRQCVSWGAGPRAGQSLILAAKARALLQGRLHAGIADVRHVARPVLRHRIVTTFHAEAEGIDPDTIIAHLLEATPAPPNAPPPGWSRADRPPGRPPGASSRTPPGIWPLMEKVIEMRFRRM